MSVGRILVNGVDSGTGFTIGPETVVTAHHVVKGSSAREITYVADGLPGIVIDRLVDVEESLDIAILHLSGPARSGLSVGYAAKHSEWEVNAQPLPNDPLLRGTIESTAHPYRNKGGRAMRVLQLRAYQHVGDFDGYSGSPVLSPHETVVGVVFEQGVATSGRVGSAW